MTTHQQFASGLRIEARDAEWRIKRVDYSSDGGYLLTCEGLSEIIRGKETLFLTEQEALGAGIRILDPETTQLVDDLTPNFRASLLYLDTLLRKTPPTDEFIHIAQRAAMDQLPFQLDPALQALSQPRQRILIADSVGLGKTLEAGILVSELIARGRGKRILVLAVKSMLAQFQQEFWNRFSIPLVRLDSVGLQRVRNRIPANHNPFHYFDRSIISIDTLKQDIEYRHHLEKAYWDIIIIDEAHNVAERNANSQRAKLAKLLATRSDTLIMLSATPHDGKATSFASLMNMLDPTAIANPKDYSQEDFRNKGLVIRRFKKDVREQLKQNFPEREIDTVRTPASFVEEAAYDQLCAAKFYTLDGHGAGQLFRTVLEKALFSSPAACLSTIENRLKRLKSRTSNDEIVADISTLEGLRLAIQAIKPDQFSKYQRLVALLKPDGSSSLGWSPKQADDRLVIFTESLITLNFLQKHLPDDLGLKSKQVAVLRGDMRDKDLMDAVEQFNKLDSPIRMLLCSDVASEGINLHHLSHRMIHFDIPWSLMVFQQRNGRIDRYGQQRRPQIRYLLTESDNTKVRGDSRVLDILIEKDAQAGKNIGDPSEFMGKFNPEEEEAIVAAVIERDKKDDDDISDIFADLLNGTDTATDLLAQFTPETPPSHSFEQALKKSPRLFEQDLHYAEQALRWLRESGVDLQADIEGDLMRLTAPNDLVQRLRYLPSEVRPDNDRFILSNNKQRIYDELKRCREEDSPWPDIQYLWEQHPVMEWLADRALNAFGRHTAPVLRLNTLSAQQQFVLIYGGFPNKRGHILVHDWLAVEFNNQTVLGIKSLEAFLEQLQLQPGKLANRGAVGDTASLQKLLPLAIPSAKKALQKLRLSKQSNLSERLLTQLDQMNALKRRHVEQLEIDFGDSAQPEAIKKHRIDDRRSHIERVFQDHLDWLQNTQTTEEEPFIQVAAVFTGTIA
ncbi:DEAD/DEAH box helicase [Methylotuvimicrobium sp. KM1]|uniref:DEAD/DEAH box helicase n=1 Tax=Methylotuvimicrobium sp. KM1 TaxID=3377707 RepID=UPI00384B3DA7